MDKATVKAMQDDLAKAVVDVAAKYGMRIKKNHARYSDLEVTLTFGLVTENAAAILTKAKADWARYCGSVGLTPEDFGREFYHNGKTFIVTGINLGRTRFPITACLKGTTKSYKFDAYTVQLMLAKY